MTSLATQSHASERAFAQAPSPLPIHLDHCPPCKRPIDPDCRLVEPIPLTKIKHGTEIELAWCPACALAFRGFFRDDGESRLMTRVDRLERDDADAIKVRKHHEHVTKQKGGA